MFVLRILAYLFGCVSLIVSGRTLERFINMANSRGIHLWDIKRLGPDRILIKTRLSGVKPLRHIARRTGSRFSVQERMGFPFLISRLRRRRMLVLGAVMFLAALYTLSSFVWFIEVTGNTKLSDHKIIEAVREAGLYPGVPKWRFEVARIEDEVLKKLPSLSWVGIQIRGTKAYIEVAEKKLPDVTEEKRPTHIVAAKAGLIEEILVLSGQAVVKEGDTVLPGQVLISGEIWPPDALQEGDEATVLPEGPRYVQAKGIVRARVWYEEYGEMPLVEEGCRFTGTEVQRICLKVAGHRIKIRGPREAPFKDYESETKVWQAPQWRSLPLPVEIISTTFREIRPYRVEHSRERALALAREEAEKRIRKVIPDGSKILNRKINVIYTGKKEPLVRVKLEVETMEDIGRLKPFKPS
ncbi:MAG: sporulation protein YqfD [Peptococcaceae bacterium]|nr:sporulation protein YqfD [Peptococcaceae bacterium]